MRSTVCQPTNAYTPQTNRPECSELWKFKVANSLHISRLVNATLQISSLNRSRLSFFCSFVIEKYSKNFFTFFKNKNKFKEIRQEISGLEHRRAYLPPRVLENVATNCFRLAVNPLKTSHLTARPSVWTRLRVTSGRSFVMHSC